MVELYGGQTNELGLPVPSFADYALKGESVMKESKLEEKEKEKSERGENGKANFNKLFKSPAEIKQLMAMIHILQKSNENFKLLCLNPQSHKFEVCDPKDISPGNTYKIIISPLKQGQELSEYEHPKDYFTGGSLADLHPLNIRGGGIKQLAKSTVNLFNPRHWQQQKKIVRENLARKAPIGKYAETRAFMSAEAYKPKNQRQDIENYKYLPEHSGSTHAVYMDPASGHKILAFRGTKPKEISDLRADLGIATGTVGSNRRFKQGLSTFQKLQKQLGNDKWETTGHSLGATLALYTAQKNGIQSHAFNPGFVHASDDDIDTRYKNHNIYVNAEDPISKSILKRKIEGNLKVVPSYTSNPLKNHSIQGFLVDVQPAGPSPVAPKEISLVGGLGNDI